VLVIIGLLLGGVLKGQELINSAKVKNMATDFRNIPLFIYGYQDKFKALPGDHHTVVAAIGATATLATTPITSGWFDPCCLHQPDRRSNLHRQWRDRWHLEYGHGDRRNDPVLATRAIGRAGRRPDGDC
jgi:hypothetical protein